MTDDLFADKYHAVRDKYPEMSELVAYVRARLGGSDTLEVILSDLYVERVKNDESLYSAFAALLFYIADLFGNISSYYFHEINNYAVLQAELKQFCGEAIYVNFNYDLLLERTLTRTKAEAIDTYIKGKFPVIKIHGAYDWYYERAVNLDDDKPSYDLSVRYPKPIFQDQSNATLTILNIGDPKQIMSTQYNSIEGVTYHPAIALPVADTKKHVCPDTHIDVLKAALDRIDRIIIIGWKVGDQYLRDVLVEQLKKKPVPIAFIGGKHAVERVESLPEPLRKNVSTVGVDGFSGFVKSDKIKAFLTQ